MNETLHHAKKIWDYHHVNHKLTKSDCIFVLGSNDLRVAEYAANLYLEGYAPLLVFSGGLGNLTLGVWTEPEANQFAAIAKKKGIDESAILVENKSTNTGENIRFTQRLLKEHELNPESFIVVQKPYMERRSFATFVKWWPEKEICVTSPHISFEEYPIDTIPLDLLINVMVGDLQRIKIYPEKGFQIYQEIPDDVWVSCQALISQGYDKHLVV